VKVNHGFWKNLVNIAFQIALYVSSGFLILLVFRKLQFLGDLLFEQIVLSSLCSLFSILILRYFFNKQKILELFIVGLIGALTFFMLSSFSLVNIDRSRSFYVLAWADEGKIRTSVEMLDLSNVVSLEKSNVIAIKTRIDEQVARGLIVEKEGLFGLTKYGKLYLKISKFLAATYNLQNWHENNH